MPYVKVLVLVIKWNRDSTLGFWRSRSKLYPLYPRLYRLYPIWMVYLTNLRVFFQGVSYQVLRLQKPRCIVPLYRIQVVP